MHRNLNHHVFASLLLSALLAITAACGPGRTAAATQPTPAAFDPSQSDEKALALVDEMLQAIGGAEQWAQVKELRWETKYFTDGTLEAWFKHSWDMWNGRHRYEGVDMKSYKEAEESGHLEDTRWLVVMYDLFDRSSGYATFGGNDLMAKDVAGAVEQAYERWQQDSYQLTMLYKLRDPGVQLSYVGEVAEVNGKCSGGCIELKVSFAPGVGTDTYYLDLDKETKLPEIIGKKVEAGRIGFAIEEWAEVGGLKLPAKFQILGATQVIELSNIEVHAKPDDMQYIPAVRG